MSKENVIGHVVCFANPTYNGGESLIISTEFLHDGDPSDCVYLNQTITLQSYCNSASFNLAGAILTPEVLRAMADQIEEKLNIIEQNLLVVRDVSR